MMTVCLQMVWLSSYFGLMIVSFTKNKAIIDDVINSLKDRCLLEKEEDATEFLGIQVTRNSKNGMTTITQAGLIYEIFSSKGMNNFNPKYTQADEDPLYKDVLGYPCTGTWSYISIVVMLLYLTRSTKPDITFVVHQCARFYHAPKHSHEVGLKHIASYLEGMRT